MSRVLALARRPWFGPAAIIGLVLIVLRDWLLPGPVSVGHPDILPFWLPTHCHLGERLAALDLPSWNPHLLAGAPFAADPQSGWLHLPAMALYTALPCDLALRAFVVLQPVVAGLGLYAFLRTEKMSRLAATAGGLALALPIAGSRFSVSLPFSTSFAWTAVTLAAAAGLLRARTTGSRLGWAAALGVAWTQLATAHISNGLASGTMILGAFWLARIVHDVRRGQRSVRGALLVTGLGAAAVGAIAAGALVPRLIASGDTVLASSFGGLEGSPGSLGLFKAGLSPGWIFRLVLSPGASVGLIIPALAGAGLRSRKRALVWGMLAFAAVSYLLALDVVARWAGSALGRDGAIGWYLHLPERFGFGLLVAFAVLAGAGLDVVRRAPSVGARLRLLAPGAGIALAGALVIAGLAWALLLPVAAAAAALLVSIRARRPSRALAGVLAAELALGGLLMTAGVSATGRAEPLLELPIAPVDLAAYVRPGPIARAMATDPDARFLSLDDRGWTERGTYNRQEPSSLGFMGTHRAPIVGLEEAQGFDPFQLRGPWLFSRVVDPRPLIYNATSFRRPPPRVYDLFRVGWVVTPRGEEVSVRVSDPVATEGRWVLRRLLDVAPRASVVSGWSVAGSQEEAVRRAASESFDPRSEAVLERVPGIPSADRTGAASVRRPEPDRLVVVARSPSPAIVVIREAWDRRWSASVDGRPATILRADGFLLAVPVPAGTHTILLEHDDPALLAGLLVSLAAVLALGTGAFALRSREEPRRSS